MKKLSTLKRFFCFLLVGVLMTCSIHASALEKGNLVLTPELQESDLVISQEVAKYIATFFLQDMIEDGHTVWTDSTVVVNEIPLYDETGEGITAYGFTLSSGYIIVSAYVDMPNLILEWADDGEPVYSQFAAEMANSTTTDSISRIIYLGGLDYYYDTGANEVMDTQGAKVNRTNLHHEFNAIRDVKNIPQALLTYLSGTPSVFGDTIMPLDNKPGEPISDPFAYAKYYYPGTWKAVDWQNKWEKYANYATVNGFVIHKECCGPVAITNLIKMYGNMYYAKKGITLSAKSKSNTDIFLSILSTNTENGNKYYTDASNGGSPWNLMGEFTKKSFARLGITVSIYGTYSPTYDDIKNATTDYRLMLVNIKGHNGYNGGHAVVGYACTTLQESSTGRQYKFLKACDGKSTTARYFDVDSMTGCGDEYWEVYFNGLR